MSAPGPRSTHRLRSHALRWARLAGIDLVAARSTARHLRSFAAEARAYGRDEEFPLRLSELWPVLTDRNAAAGIASGHYFHQDLWAARKIYDRRPDRHLDVGSRIDGFVAHLLLFMPVEVVDIRPLPTAVAGLTTRIADAATLKGIDTGSAPSLSCLHALEHMGLGRYGDPVDRDGWRKALGSLARVLAPGGRLYLSVPMGRQRLEFNAQRVFAPTTLLTEAADLGLSLVASSVVDDAGDLHDDVDPAVFADAEYACGLFELTR